MQVNCFGAIFISDDPDCALDWMKDKLDQLVAARLGSGEAKSETTTVWRTSGGAIRLSRRPDQTVLQFASPDSSWEMMYYFLEQSVGLKTSSSDALGIFSSNIGELQTVMMRNVSKILSMA